MKIRLFGLALLALCGLGFAAMTRLAGMPPADRSIGLELGIGTVCMLAEMAGMAMLVFGRALFAPTPAPMRSWHSVSGYVADY